MTTQRELVQVTSPRNWKTGTISMDSPAHGTCKRCGVPIWWGSIQFKGQPKPAWIAFVEAGHGGGGAMAMIKHECKPV